MIDQRTGGGVDRRIVLLVAATASFLTPFMATSVNIALPSIGREFSLDAVTLSWITTAYLLAAAMLLVPFGQDSRHSGPAKGVPCRHGGVHRAVVPLHALHVRSDVHRAPRNPGGLGCHDVRHRDGNRHVRLSAAAERPCAGRGGGFRVLGRCAGTLHRRHADAGPRLAQHLLADDAPGAARGRAVPLENAGGVGRGPRPEDGRDRLRALRAGAARSDVRVSAAPVPERGVVHCRRRARSWRRSSFGRTGSSRRCSTCGSSAATSCSRCRIFRPWSTTPPRTRCRFS